MEARLYKQYVTGLLLVVYIFNQTDRAIFGILMEPIKRELGLNDSQLGFLAGPALVLLYATLGIPVARLADRASRVGIIAIAVALWSAAVISSAAVSRFWQLALVRVGVGVGEAGFSAVAQSLIADHHSAAERPRALSVFMLGIPLGALVSNLLGGSVNQAYGWRAAFVIAGLPGFALALLVWRTINEPRRASNASGPLVGDHQLPLREVLRDLWRRRALRHLGIAMVLANMVSACASMWLPAFFMRNHAMGTAELGVWLGVITSLGGSVGTLLGGFVVSHFGGREERQHTRILAAAAALSTPMLVAMLVCPSKQISLLLAFPAYLLMFFTFGPAFSLLQGLSPVGMRTTTVAVVIFGEVVFAGVFSAQLVGVLSDVILTSGSGNSLRWAMLIISMVGIWAAVHYWLSGRFVRQELRDISAGSVSLQEIKSV